MFEGLVEEDKPKFKVGDKITNGKESFIVLQIASNKYIIEDNLGEYDTLYFDSQNDWGLVREKVRTINEPLFKTSNIPLEKEIEWSLPEGYVFKDENGNIINATKIVLEKKEKMYPKTYEECCKVLDWNHRDYDRVGYESELLCKFQVLLLCRDAYWKIAGEEIGLGKPWEPDWKKGYQSKYCICNNSDNIKKISLFFDNAILSFPTLEMRDAFYQNFKNLIEICKELL